MKFDETATVVSQNEISDGIYDMWIDTGNIAANAVPGQFISVYTKDASKLLPRPISICETDGSRLIIVYRIAGNEGILGIFPGRENTHSRTVRQRFSA